MVGVKQNNNSEQVQVCLHMGERSCSGETPSCIQTPLSSDIIVNSLHNTVKDKKNKTTNVPSNCCTAIMMPLTGGKSNSQQFDLFHHQYLDNALSYHNKSEVQRRELTVTKCKGDDAACDRYNIYNSKSNNVSYFKSS